MNITRPHPLLSYGFRPFFLLFGVFSCLLVMSWLTAVLLGWQLPVGIHLLGWHSHEMLYGLVPAAIAGFLLTATPNWTGAPALAGGRLGLLVTLWLAGRLSLFFSAPLMSLGIHYLCIAAVDVAFLLILALYIGRVLIRHKNTRNLILIGVLIVLDIGNITMHLGLHYNRASWVTAGQGIAFDVITLMMIIIAGRITPAFSANWLRAQGLNGEGIAAPNWINAVAISSIILLMCADRVLSNNMLIGCLAGAAAIANGVRLGYWKAWRVIEQPLLWILHLAYFWIVISLTLRAAGSVIPALSPSAWQHILGIGGMGTLIFGVMTRVCLGHTGRPLTLPNYAITIYTCISFSTILRLAVVMGWIDFRIGLGFAGILWIASGLFFTVLYGPMLWRARVDERIG